MILSALIGSILFVLGIILWRRLFGRVLTHGLPANAGAPPLPARAAEAAFILLAGLLLILLCGTQRSYNGLLLTLNHLSNPLASAMLIATLLGCGLIAFSARLAWKGFTGLGIATGAATVIGYSAFLNAGSAPGFDLLPPSPAPADIPFTIRTTGPDVVGAELWVNNTFLGKLPYHANLQDFLSSVPYWENPPADFNNEMVEVISDNGKGMAPGRYPRWLKFETPPIAQPPLSGARSAATQPRYPAKTFYARIKYDGEWAVATGNFGGGSNGATYTFRAEAYIGIDFPARSARLAALIDRARADQFNITSTLLADMMAFRQDGWFALYQAREKVPAADDALEAWANTTYPFHAANSPAAAWDLFLKICADAEAAGAYNTFSPAGRAVERLAPRLPADALLAKAFPLFTSVYNSNHGYSTATRFGEFHFSTIESEDPSNLTPPTAFVIAQALVAMHKSQLAKGAYPTVVQEKLVPFLLRLNPTADLNCRIAALFGGPVATHYFFRQNFQLPADALPHDERFHIAGVGATEVNAWRYCIAQLQDPAAHAFRRLFAGDFLALADQLTPDWTGRLGDNVDFLFQDPELSARFWPRFSQKLRNEPKYRHYALNSQFDYLIRMNADTSLFVEAYTNTDADHFDEPTTAFEKLAAIPDPKRRAAVIAALRGIVQPTPPPPNFVRGFGSAEFARASLLKALDTAEKGEK